MGSALAGASSSRSSTWLRTLKAAASPRMALICFPHAGGTSAAYQPWARYFPADIALTSIVYPGREARVFEPLIDSMNILVQHVSEAVRSALDCPIALFGHSLGAAIAYEVACRLRDDCGVLPAHLFVSGRCPPVHQKPGARHLGDDQALWDELRRLGGTREAVLEYAELKDFLLPIVRNDYRLSETYLPPQRAPLPCPITAFVGDEDTEVSVEQAEAWRQCGCGDFSLHVFRGGHFYLIPRREALIEELLRVL